MDSPGFDCSLLLPCMQSLRYHASEELRAGRGHTSTAAAEATGTDSWTTATDGGEPGASPYTDSLSRVCTWLLRRVEAAAAPLASSKQEPAGVDAAADPPPAVDWDTRMALTGAVALYLQLAGGLSAAVPTLAPAPAGVLLAFLRGSLALVRGRRLRPGELVPCHIPVLLGCAGDLFSQPAVRTSLARGSASAACLRDAVDTVYCLFRSLCIDVLAPDPQPPAPGGGRDGDGWEDDGGGSGSARAAVAAPSTGEGSGEGVPLADGMNDGDILPLDSRHRLCSLVRRLRSELGTNYLAAVHRGILTRRSHAGVPVDIVRTFRRCTICLARTVLPEVHAYCLVCNPETGRPSRHTIEFLAELATPGGDVMRCVRLCGPCRQPPFCRRWRVVGHGGEGAQRRKRPERPPPSPSRAPCAPVGPTSRNTRAAPSAGDS